MSYKYYKLPLLGFDTETTGVDVYTDRIVSCNLTYDFPNHPEHNRSDNFLINPGVDIPVEASNVHGLTKEYLEENNAESPEKLLQIIHDRLLDWEQRGLPAVAYNATYDASILTYEWERHGVEQKVSFSNVIDPMVIDKQVDKYRKGGRKLETVAKLYGFTITNAHSADADVEATIHIARKLGESYGAELTFEDQGEGLLTMKKWKKEQSESLERYFRKTNPDAVVASGYPVY